MKLFFTILFIILFNFSYSQNWRAAGLGANFNIQTFLTDSNQKLYAGGAFTSVDGLPRTAIAIWDSVQWNNFGSNAIFHGNILSMTFFHGELIVGGKFDSINNIPFNNVAKWDGSNWLPLGNGLNNNVYTLQVYHDQLYAGGSFYISGNDTIGHLAKWDGINWIKAVNRINDYVFSSTIYRNKLVIGGQFSQINGSYISNVAEFDDSLWLGLNINFNNSVYTVKSLDDTLYACGNFTQIPGYPFNYICKYDGNSWNQVPYPIGTTNSVVDIEKYNSKIYICGNFDNPDDLAKINGMNCDSVGSSNGFYVCMTTYKNELYVGGNFTHIGSLSSNCMAIYNDDFNSGFTEFELRNLSVYPNPVSKATQSKLRVKSETQLKIKLISIYSIHGQLLFESKTDYLLIDDLTTGVYVVVLKTIDDKSFSTKLIIVP